MLAHQWLSVSGASSEIVNKPRSPLYEGLAVIKLRAHTKKFDKGKNLSTNHASLYSRNLNHLWLMGAIVGIWHGPMTEPHARPRARKPSYAIRAT